MRDVLARVVEANERWERLAGQLRVENAELRAETERLRERDVQREAELERVSAELAVLQRLVFGRSSERVRPQPAAGAEDQSGQGDAPGERQSDDDRPRPLNLRDEDYGRPLNEVRDSFWSAPRLPLLPGGEDGLRRAIYQAVTANSLRLVDAAGDDVTVTNPSEINLSQSGLRLAKPEPAKNAGSSDGTSDTETSGGTGGSGAGETTTGNDTTDTNDLVRSS